MNLKQLPKIELHLHLDGSVRLTTAQELSGNSLEEVRNQMIAPTPGVDLNQYLTKFDLPVQIMQTKENLTRIAYELGCDLKDDGVIYAEVRFAPLKHTKQGLAKEEVVNAVLEGFSQVTGIELRLILCMMRDDSFASNQEVLKLAEQYRLQGVVAVDLAGAEALFPTEQFASLFQQASAKKIPFTIHAGEAAGLESLEAAISFGTTRIGHGIRLIEFPELFNQVKDQILLEVCPTSNLQTNVVASYQTHPLRALFDQGCFVCINTDNRTVSNTTLTNEYEHMMEAEHFTIADLIQMNETAIRFSFAEPETKQALFEQIEVYKRQNRGNY